MMFRRLKKSLRSFKETASKELAEATEEEVKIEKKERKRKAKSPKKGRKKRKSEGSKEVFTEQRGKKLREGKLDDLLSELEMTLLESDVALPVVETFREDLKKELLGRKISREFGVEEVVESSLRKSIANVLAQKAINFDNYVDKHDKPVVLMFVGVNGTGKTTAIAKIVHRLQALNYSCVIAASDTFRAGAIEQLEKHAQRLGTKLIKHQAGGDPAAVAFDAIEHARARKKDVVLIDTAGRMHSNINLMDEMKKIKRVSKPHMIIFVGDALAGNDAVIQAQKFDETVGIDCAILTKIDADAKGGAALSIAHAVGKPILFVGVGQGYDDLVAFNPDWMVNRLFEES